MQLLQDLDPWEVQIAVNFLQNQRFENSFVSDSDLSSPMQSTPIRLFLSAPGRIKDALLALAGVLSSQGSSSSSNDADAIANMERCCKAMERLRQTDVSSIDDAKATLFVATSLISVNDMTLGYGFLPVARAALLSIQPWYYSLVNTPSSETDPHLIPVLFAEISECIKCCEIPTFRYGNPSAHVIDPSYGVAQEVLPHLYDICVLRQDIKSGELSTINAMAQAAKINHEVQTCDIDLFMDLAQLTEAAELSDVQRDKIVQHGKCYTLMTQLLLHQLQLNFSDLAEQAAEIAQTLRHAITSISTDTQSRIQYLLFPYFVACTELQDEFEQGQVLHRMEMLSGGIATQSCNRMYEFLQYVWAIQSVDPTACWLDLVEDGINFSIGP